MFSMTSETCLQTHLRVHQEASSKQLVQQRRTPAGQESNVDTVPHPGGDGALSVVADDPPLAVKQANCPGFIEKNHWPTNRFDPLDYHVWGAMLEKYHKL